MKRLVIGAAVAGAAALAFHCRSMMRDHCQNVAAGCRPHQGG